MTSLSSLRRLSRTGLIFPPALDHPEVQASHHRPVPQLIDLGHQGLSHLPERPLPFPIGHAGLQSALSKPKRIRAFCQLVPQDLGSELLQEDHGRLLIPDHLLQPEHAEWGAVWDRTY